MVLTLIPHFTKNAGQSASPFRRAPPRLLLRETSQSCPIGNSGRSCLLATWLCKCPTFPLPPACRWH
eukprot:94349-Lingulodinium_polyedra.AAC.1